MPSRRLRIVTSHRLDALLRALADALAAAPLPPLAREVVVVQSQGMRRWVTLQLADRLGCAASLYMPFPGAFGHRLAEAADAAPHPAPPGGYEDSPFGRDALTWRIDDALDALLPLKGFAPLRAYLADGDARKRHQLCARVANLFDDYQIYRPDLLLAWEAGKDPVKCDDAAWQAELWRRLTREAPADHLARRFERLIESLETCAAPPKGLPPRLAVFGVTTLPPVFIRLLRGLARFVEVSLYVVAANNGRPTTDDAIGGGANPLVASMGGQGQTFLDLLRENFGAEATWDPIAAAPPPRDSLLHRLQADALAGLDRTFVAAPPAAPPGRTATDTASPTAADDSLTVHICHSPLREMEVLRDQLLAAFAADPELRPHDILVMTPDVATYAPYARSVFGVDHPPAPRLPVRVADRRVAHELPLTEVFCRALTLARGRVTATEVLDLLECPAVQRRAGFTESDLPVLAQWVADANIRWGVDAAARRAEGLPPESANTWRAGFERLLLGYAVGPCDDLVAGTLPLGSATAGRADLLGRFVDWCERLFRCAGNLRRERPLREWAADLNAWPDQFLEARDDEERDAIARIRGELRRLDTLALAAAHNRPVPLDVLCDHFEHAFADDGFGTGFISGAITFCAMKPMRTIPFKIIAVCGLGHDAFPRRDRPPAFDLQARAPRPGDRSLRADDRQLFLETFLAAGRRLIVTYVGASQKDNSERPPSVCLAELLDAVERAYGPETRRTVLLRHPLQPFSAAYYNGRDARLFSYSAENCRAGRAAGGARHAQLPFITRPFPIPEGRLTVSAADLARAWLRPCRLFCERTLDLRFPADDAAEVENVEPLALDNLTRTRVADWLLARRLAGATEDETTLLAARGDLPPGRLGRALRSEIERQVGPVLDRLRDAQFLPPAELSVQGVDWTLTGRIEGLTDRARLQYRCAAIKPKDLARAWTAHLLLNAAAEEGAALPRVTRLIGTDGERRFGPVARPRKLLDALLAGYRRALAEPLPLFEEAGYAFAARLHDPKRSDDPVATAWKEAYAAWFGDDFRNTPGDRDDPFVALCFRGGDPFRDRRGDFESLARAFWAPLMDHVEEGEA